MNAAACLLFAIVILIDLRDGSCRDFTYMGRFGPDHWAEKYNTCNGKHQSPININVMDVVAKEMYPLQPFAFNEVPLNGELINNGHTVLVKYEYNKFKHPSICDGPLTDDENYIFSQLHFHWGENDTVGSEDRINNVSFPAELHLVFWNSAYDSFEQAVKHKYGVAVMAYFFAIQEEDNRKYSELIELLSEVRMPNTSASFSKPKPLIDLITTDFRKFYTYIGSLTTPPCSEDVTWIDFSTPIMISAKQLDAFRQLYAEDGIPLIHNFRPIQPLNNRPVYEPLHLAPRVFVQPPPASSIPLVDVSSAADTKMPSTVSVNFHMLLVMAVMSMTFAWQILKFADGSIKL